jgi:peptidoglycan/LPS O-acetylase OafA/YrhL
MTTSEALKSEADAAEPRQSPSSRRILRRIGAVLAGLFAVAILDTIIDVVLHATGVYPPWFQPMATPLWFLAIGYRAVDGVIGGYIAARLAPDRPVKHALALGIIGVVLATAGVVATWNKGPEFGPKWYPLALVVIALPCALIGGKLRERQLAR